MKLHSVIRRVFQLLVPLPENNFSPQLLDGRALTVAALLSLLVFVAIVPIGRSRSYQMLLASLSEDLLIGRVNPAREASAVPPLRVNALLSQAARNKAQDMIARDYFAHIGPDGEVPWVWLEGAGYRYNAAGENLAIDFADPDTLVQAWLASPSHAENIKNGTFTEIGMGIADGEFQGRITTVVAMFVAKPSAAILAAGNSAPAPPAVPISPPPPAAAPALSPPPPAPSPVPTPTPAPSPSPNPVSVTPPPAPSAPAAEPTEVLEQPQSIPAPQEPFILLRTAGVPSDAPEPSEPRRGETESELLSAFFTKAAPFARLFITGLLGLIIVSVLLSFVLTTKKILLRTGEAGLSFLLLLLLWLPIAL